MDGEWRKLSFSSERFETHLKFPFFLMCLIVDQGASIQFEKDEEGEKLLNTCQLLENLFEDLIKIKRFPASLFRWIFNNTLGTIDQV